MKLLDLDLLNIERDSNIPQKSNNNHILLLNTPNKDDYIPLIRCKKKEKNKFLLFIEIGNITILCTVNYHINRVVGNLFKITGTILNIF